MKIDRTFEQMVTELIAKDVTERSARETLAALEDLSILEFNIEQPKLLGAVVVTRKPGPGVQHVGGEAWTRWTLNPATVACWMGALSGQRLSWAELRDLEVEQVRSQGAADPA